jgi:hypothetical protein
MFQVVWGFREGIDSTPQAARMLAHSEVVTFHAVGVDRAADGGCVQGGFDLFGAAIDNAGRDVDYPPLLPLFDHHGIAQLRGGNGGVGASGRAGLCVGE